jgi:hypothetical protein
MSTPDLSHYKSQLELLKSKKTPPPEPVASQPVPTPPSSDLAVQNDNLDSENSSEETTPKKKVQKTPEADQGMSSLASQLEAAFRFFSKK